MKYLLYFLLVLSFTSCITERKAVDYFKTHPKVSSAFCAIEYPVKETTSVIVVEDTAKARKIKDSLTEYAQQWISLAEKRNLALTDMDRFILNMVKYSEQKDSACTAYASAIQAKLAAVPKIDITALRKSIKEELAKQIIPCKDSITIKYLENTAKTEAMQIKLDEKSQALHEMTTLKNLFLWIAIALLILNVIQYMVKNKK